MREIRSCFNASKIFAVHSNIYLFFFHSSIFFFYTLKHVFLIDLFSHKCMTPSKLYFFLRSKNLKKKREQLKLLLNKSIFQILCQLKLRPKKVVETESGYVLRGQHAGAGGDNNHLTPSASSQYLSLPLVTQTYSSAFHFQQYLSVPPVSSPTLSLSHEYFLYEAEVPCGAFHFQKYWSNTVYTVYCFTIHVQCTSRSLLKYVLISEAVYQSLIW